VDLTFPTIAGLILAGALLAWLGARWRRSGLPLTAALRRFPAPPVYATESDNLQAGILTAFLQSLFLFVLLLTPLVAFVRRDESPLTYLLLGGWANLINASLYVLARRRLQLASWLLPLGLYVMITLGLLSGVGQVGLAPYLLVIICAGLLLGARGALLYALVSSLAVGGAFFGARQGWLNVAPNESVTTIWIMYTAVFAVIALWLALAYRRVGEGSRRSSELRVTQAERNRELDGRLRQESQRAGQLELQASIARQLAGLTDVQLMLDQTTRHLVEAHNFDKAAIFLVEADELVLRSASGRQAGHPDGTRVRLGSSGVGEAAATGETQRVQISAAAEGDPGDGTQTASLVCVPLRLAKSVVGVLEVGRMGLQPIEEGDIAPLDMLADLLVAGLQTSGLFGQLRRQVQAEQRLNAEMETLRQASLQVTSSLDSHQVLEAILQQTLQLTGAHNAHIFLYDGSSLTYGAAMGPPNEPTTTYTKTRPGGLTDSVARTGQRIVIPDVNSHPLFRDWQWGGSIIGMPLRMGNRVCGVMNVAFQQPRLFDERELRVLELLADQAAIALENARLFNAEREQRSMAEALREASIALSSTLEYESLLDRLLEQVERVTPFDAAAILISSPVSRRTQVARSRGLGQLLKPGREFEIESTAGLRQMAASLEPLIISDVDSPPDGEDFAGVSGLRAWAGVPIAAHQQVLAFFVIQKSEAGYYRPEHGERLLAFAGQAALALQNARLFEAERRRAAQLALLSEVSQQLGTTLDESQLLQGAVTAIVHRLGYIEAAILLPEGDNELVVAAIAKTAASPTKVGFRQKFDSGVCGQAATNLATYATNDVGRDPYYFDPAGRSVGSAMALPLIREGVLLGVMYMESNLPGAFAATDIVPFETLSSHIATSLQNARLYAHASGPLRETMAVQSVSKTIVSSLEPGRVMATVVELLHDTFGYDFVSLYVLWEGRLHLEAQVGYAADVVFKTIQPGLGVTGRSVRTRETQFVRDVEKDPDFLREMEEVQSEICVPLVKDREVLGILNVESARGTFLTEADASLLTTLGSQVTVALDNARLFEAERGQREFSEALRRASLALTATLDLDTLLDRLLEEIEVVVPYDAASILLVENGYAVTARQRGFGQVGEVVGAAMDHAALEVAQTPNLAQMMATGQSMIVADTATEPGWVGVAATPYVRSWAGAPILAQGQVLAFLSLHKREPDYYRPAHGSRLVAFAGQAALALQNAQLFAEQQRRTEEQRLLLTAEQDFSAALSETAVLQAIVEHMSAILDAAGCTISIWNREEDSVNTLQDFARAESMVLEAPGTRYALADFPATRLVLEERRAILINVDDLEADPAERALLAERGYGAVLMVPLASGEQVFGLVELNRLPGSARFAPTDVHLAQNLAVQAGVALENARLHSAVQETVRELDALLTANKALLSTLELDQLLHNILAAAVEAIPNAEMGTISLADPLSEQLRVRAVYGYSDPRIQTLSFSWNEGYSGKALRENQPLLLSDTDVVQHLVPITEIAETISIRSAIVAPLVPKASAGRPYGVISLDATHPNAFTPADLRILVAFANTAAAAIDNARLHAEVQRLAVTDSLTGLANPRAFEHALATEAHRAGRYGHPLSLIIMDIDAFKNFNDEYGHLAGNERLKAIANVLHETVRDPDLPARYGGEEFALLLPHTGKGGAISLAERIRVAAEAASPRAPASGEPVSGYTLSLGVATFPEDARSAQQLLLAADNAELAAKRSGKNRVCTAQALTLTAV
jgi:diguanylate cyclase (GGDEF)-like protein